MEKIDAEKTCIVSHKNQSLGEDISKTHKRFLMLVFICFICFGSFFAYDSPTSIQKELEEVFFM